MYKGAPAWTAALAPAERGGSSRAGAGLRPAPPTERGGSSRAGAGLRPAPPTDRSGHA
jgi:hypothetical protein